MINAPPTSSSFHLGEIICPSAHSGHDIIGPCARGGGTGGSPARGGSESRGDKTGT